MFGGEIVKLNSLELKDKVYIVTGGSSGLGKAMAVSLIENGSKVIITGRNLEKLKRELIFDMRIHGFATSKTHQDNATFIIGHYGNGTNNDANIICQSRYFCSKIGSRAA